MMRLTKEQEAKLQAAKIVRQEKSFLEMSRAELAVHFAAKRSRRIKIETLMRSVIWQVYERLQTGVELPFKGNLRSFWYRFIKVVLAHMLDDDRLKSDPYDLMLEAFGSLVSEHQLLRYQDFDFTDENWELRRIGPKRPEVLVFAEKRGWMRFLKEVHEAFGVSVLALGGAPSALTSEYTARDIKAALGKEAPAHLIGIVDYDPSGYLIAEAFREQLRKTGLESVDLVLLIKPEHYTEEELALYRFPLPKGQPTKTERWLKKTGGIDGKAYGLESESMPQDRLSLLLRQELARLL